MSCIFCHNKKSTCSVIFYIYESLEIRKQISGFGRIRTQKEGLIRGVSKLVEVMDTIPTFQQHLLTLGPCATFC